MKEFAALPPEVQDKGFKKALKQLEKGLEEAMKIGR